MQYLCKHADSTRDVYRHTTSNVAAGEWGPVSTHDDLEVDAAFLSRLDWAARVSHHAYTNLTGTKYGIRWLETYNLYDAPFDEPDYGSFDDLFTYKGDLVPGEHPFGDSSRNVEADETERIVQEHRKLFESFG